MSFNGFLNHKCDIYHIQREDKSPGYALPTSPSFSYPDKPDIAATPCHFHNKSGSITITQGSPQAKYEVKIKLSLPFETDIRLNDKVVDRESGYEYTTGLPRAVRRHHIAVYLHRSGLQEAL